MRRLLLAILLFAAPAFAYDPPIGIPAPPFGIDEMTTDGTYTHWVDNDDGGCTDTANDGTPGTPRCTIPTTLAAGSICQIRGTSYSLPTNPLFTLNGTAGSPVYFRGPDTGTAPILVQASDVKSFTGSYYIVENIDTDRVNMDGDHFVIRGSEIHGHFNRNATQISTGTDAVIYNNHIHTTGNQVTPDDRHGVWIAPTSQRVWILENEIDHCSGDGMQFCHFCAEPGPQYVYIGGNNIHENAENAVDFKTAQHVVVSQNEMWGHVPTGGSDGTAMLIGSNGLDDQAVDVWVIFNNIHDNSRGIRIEAAANGSGGGGPAYILGNVIRDCTSGAIIFDKNGDLIHIVNNTIENCDVFLDVTWREFFDIAAFDNVVVDMQGDEYAGDHLEMEIQGVAAVSEVDRTVFYQSGGSVKLMWDSPAIYTYALSADMSAFPGGANNMNEDPLFVNQTTHDFNLQVGSPAIDIGSESSIYDLYFSTFGESIKVDYDGVSRPQGAGWDAGAFEYESGAPAPAITIGKFCMGSVCLPLN